MGHPLPHATPDWTPCTLFCILDGNIQNLFFCARGPKNIGTLKLSVLISHQVVKYFTLYRNPYHAYL